MSAQSKQGRTKHNTDWENPSPHPEFAEWIKLVNTDNPLEDIYYFQCRMCNYGKLSLSNMGVGAAKSHVADPKGKQCKHNSKIDYLKGIRPCQIDFLFSVTRTCKKTSCNEPFYSKISTPILFIYYR